MAKRHLDQLTKQPLPKRRKVDFRVQLNIQNLLNETDPLLTAIDTDTNAVYGTANAEVPVYYTLRRPRNFVLSTTFEF